MSVPTILFSRTSHDITSIQHAVVTEGLYRQDLISSLVGAGVSHIAIKVPNILFNLTVILIDRYLLNFLRNLKTYHRIDSKKEINFGS